MLDALDNGLEPVAASEAKTYVIGSSFMPIIVFILM